MKVAINDISFLEGFDDVYEAREALVRFADVALRLREDRVSIVSNEIFAKETLRGTLNGDKECEIRNIADESHIDYYWEELGFRLYEINPKHGTREYIRSGGQKVGIAPESDELGQYLLNRAIKYKGKLLSVDAERNDRIFEFRHSYANKFHGFLQDNLREDDRRKIVEVAKQEEAARRNKK